MGSVRLDEDRAVPVNMIHVGVYPNSPTQRGSAASLWLNCRFCATFPASKNAPLL